MKATTTPILEQQFWPVKSNEIISIGSTDPSMIHHKVSLSRKGKVIVSYSSYRQEPYGVSKTYRLLSPQILLKKFDLIQDCLQDTVGLTITQTEVVLRLLRYWAYYGKVYPKETSVTEQPGCSKATFWRTVRLLKECGLLEVCNRFVLRAHAQISNSYRFDKLVILLAKYLAEHIAHVWPKWLLPYIKIPWSELWSALSGEQLKLPRQSVYGHTGTW